ncbi:MAG: carboxypeptidase-like regulatory domain-containing protein, partial [Sediminibacterium sp.]|nr:carboxypeptidase-like regulatory domain-containing protein [Sediminibacterium sp.]
MKLCLKSISLLLLIGSFYASKAQSNGVLTGTILNKTSQQPVAGATIQLTTIKTAISDSAGYFRIAGITPGAYSITIKALGFNTQIRYNIAISVGNENNIGIELDPFVTVLNDVSVTSTARNKSAKAATLETPLSVQRLTTEEIKSNPGGNFDISRV